MKTIKDWAGLTLTEEPVEYSYSITQLGDTQRQSVRRTYKGTQEQIEALLPTLANNGWSFEVKQGPIWEVVATLEHEEPIVQWELSSDAALGNVLVTINPLTKDLDPVIVAKVKQAIDNNGTLDFLSPSKVPADKRQLATDLYFHYQHGVQEYYLTYPVLRKTYIVHNRYALNESIVGVNRIYTKGGMIAADNVPSQLHGLLPDIEPEIDVGGGIKFIYGYHYGHPSYTRVGLTSYQVAAEYRYGLWPKKLYLDYIA